MEKTNIWLAGRLGGGNWEIGIDIYIYIYAMIYKMGFPGGSVVKNPPKMQETWQEL